MLIRILLLVATSALLVQCALRRGNSPNEIIHHCIHDEVSKNVDLTINPINTNPNDFGRRFGSPLRIVFNTDALTTDPDYVCLQVGQWVKFGNAPGDATSHSPICGSTASTNCWFQCNSDEVVTNAKRAYLTDKVIPDIIRTFSNALSPLVPVVGPLVLTGNTCGCSNGGVTIPDSYKTTGVPNADLVIFLTARSTRYLGSTIAFACACASASVGGRPIAGYINWSPDTIDVTDEYSYPEHLGVGIHEITHVLGFSQGSYGNYPTGSQTVQQVSQTDPNVSVTHQVSIMATPTVIEAARIHFNCPTLDGVELENGGGSGTAFSHWERRILLNEYMTGFSSYRPVFSNITLALFNDMGYYSVNFSAAQELEYGKGAGCDFVQKRCNFRSEPYNCDPVKQRDDAACTWDGRFKGVCNIRQLDGSLPNSWYNYYGDSTIGGSDSLADYCGFYRFQESYYGDCSNPDNQNPPLDWYLIENFGEHYCPSCRCMNSIDTNGIKGPSCHNLTCVAGTFLKMKIGPSWYDCLTPNQKITITDEERVYYCPSRGTSWCSEVPSYPTWINFVSISPTEGGLGDEITVVASGFTADQLQSVQIGYDYGCSEPTIEATTDGNSVTITCQIGRRQNARSVFGRRYVDVVVTDIFGRSATGIKEFRINSSSILQASILLISLIILLL